MIILYLLRLFLSGRVTRLEIQLSVLASRHSVLDVLVPSGWVLYLMLCLVMLCLEKHLVMLCLEKHLVMLCLATRFPCDLPSEKAPVTPRGRSLCVAGSEDELGSRTSSRALSLAHSSSGADSSDASHVASRREKIPSLSPPAFGAWGQI